MGLGQENFYSASVIVRAFLPIAHRWFAGTLVETDASSARRCCRNRAVFASRDFRSVSMAVFASRSARSSLSLSTRRWVNKTSFAFPTLNAYLEGMFHNRITNIDAQGGRSDARA